MRVSSADTRNFAQGVRLVKLARQRLALALTLIPGLFGILGLGLIYRNPRQKRGYVALLFGALFFILAVFLTIGVITIVAAVPCWIVYVLMYLGCAALVLMDNVFIRMG